jgi:hypothetical protein
MVTIPTIITSAGTAVSIINFVKNTAEELYKFFKTKKTRKPVIDEDQLQDNLYRLYVEADADLSLLRDTVLSVFKNKSPTDTQFKTIVDGLNIDAAEKMRELLFKAKWTNTTLWTNTNFAARKIAELKKLSGMAGAGNALRPLRLDRRLEHIKDALAALKNEFCGIKEPALV